MILAEWMGLLVACIITGSVEAAYTIDCTEDLCPYDNVTYTCMFTDNAFVKWSVDFGDKISTASFNGGVNANGTIIDYIQPFTFQLVGYSNFMGTTTANFTVIPASNGTTVTCIDAPPTFISSIGTGCAVSVKSFAPPTPPTNTSITALSDSSLRLTWSPSPSHRNNCLSHYTITVYSNEEGTVTHNVTSSITSLDLTKLTLGVEYSFSLTATDSIGREGNSSQPVSFTLKYPTMLLITVMNLSKPTCLDEAIDITVTWAGEEMYPTYNLYHNISGSAVKTTYTTTQAMLQGTQGETYSFSVEAVNQVGTGPPSNLSIVVLPLLSLEGAMSFQGIAPVAFSTPISSSTQSVIAIGVSQAICTSSHSKDITVSPANKGQAVVTTDFIPSSETTVVQSYWYILLPATAVISAAVGALLTALLACIIVKIHHRKDPKGIGTENEAKITLHMTEKEMTVTETKPDYIVSAIYDSSQVS